METYGTITINCAFIAGPGSRQEMLSGNPISYSNLRTFGCLANAHVKTDKLEPRAVKCILVGNTVAVKGFTVRSPTLLV